MALNFINPEATDSENFSVISYVVEDIQRRLNFTMSCAAGRVPVAYSDVNPSLDVKKSDKDETDVKRLKQLCRLLKVINFLKNIPAKFVELIEKLTELTQWLITKIVYEPAKWLMKKIQYVVLFIKKITIFIKLKIAKMMRSILMLMKTKGGSWLSAGLTAVVQAIMVAFKALAIAVLAVLQAVQLLLSMMPPILSVGPESMAFFMTPRSIMKTDITCANPNMSIYDRLNNSIKSAITTIINAIKVSNAAILKGIIIAGAAAGAASALTKFKIPKSICKALKVIDPKNIIKQIDTILLALAVPEALPKYENLSIKNLAFLAFLMTGFCMSGHVAFGFPGCP